MEEKEKKKVTKKKDEKDLEQLKQELKEELKKEMMEEIQKEDKKEKSKTEDKRFEDKAKETIDKIMDTEDSTNDYDKKDIDSNKGLAMISYLGPLALIPFLVSKDSKFVRYHATQGLNLFVIELIISICSYFLTSIIQIPKTCTLWGETTYECGLITPWWITLPISLLELLTFVIAIVGFIWAYQGKAKELPIVGKLKIIK